MLNLIINLKDGDSEGQEVKDFIKTIAKSIADALEIPFDLVMKNYEKEKAKWNR